MSKFSPTPEQEAIISEGRGRASLEVNAYAGCAKSTTLEMLGKEVKVPALALAFNKKIAEAMKPKFGQNFDIKTMNGLGHGAWSRALDGQRLVLDERKLGKLITQLAKDRKINLNQDQWGTARTLVSSAMANGIVPKELDRLGLVPDEPETWEAMASSLWLDPAEAAFLLPFAKEVLLENIKLAKQGIVSFDDQVYCSAMLGGKFPKFPVVFVDEAQDLSPINHEMVRQCLGGRLIVVGDRKQSIYAFRGADAQSMDKLRGLRPEESWKSLPLATTFRCPKVVVARQQFHAPGFRSWEGCKAGKVLEMPGLDKETGEGGWTWGQIEALAEGREIAVLCRNNAPLLKLAFKLLRQGIGVNMLGRDIGKGLTTLVTKLCKNEEENLTVLWSALEDWKDREIAQAKAKGDENKVDSITDRVECLYAVAEGAEARDVMQLHLALKGLFSAEGGRVTLSSIHKAKGLEWPVVIHLDPWRVPSKKIKQRAEVTGDDRELQQELNLAYVAETRTKDVLVLASLGGFK